MNVTFIDTSVLLNVLDVPGRNQDAAAVKKTMGEVIDSGESLILPITAVIETGNHIAQLDNGQLRREFAQKLERVLRGVVAGNSPWVLHDIAWNSEFLEKLVGGAGTGQDFRSLLEQKVGVGDLCILAECNAYASRVKTATVRIWTLDRALSSWAPVTHPGY
ncbi:MAG: hypothetical protein CSA58_08585 [Micrococcales bacterium]|nr:MAG: hypothetical protein CSB46_00860 [Micrococcales bacterium]PIE26612.1 MAG: hypothetical protein CSA58_08585 [Micrococcales bacterium]